MTWLSPSDVAVTPERLLASVAAHAEVAPTDLTGPARTREMSRLRQLSAHLIYRHCAGMSYPKLGAALGGRSQSAAQRAVGVAPDHLAREGWLKSIHDAVCRDLGVRL